MRAGVQFRDKCWETTTPSHDPPTTTTTPHGVETTPSGAEATLPLGVGADGTQEVDAPEVGPVGLAEVELALRALPEQEAAEPLLPRGPDHQVGVALALGVEVLGDVL